MKLSRLLLIVGIVAVLGIVALLGSNLSLSSKAALSVISDPTGEKVAIDGQEVGATPFYSDNLSEGEVTLTFGDFSQKIKLTGGALTVVNWILTMGFFAAHSNVSAKSSCPIVIAVSHTEE